jgi:hypothetical protein
MTLTEQVTLTEGDEYAAEVVGVDVDKDIAVLKLKMQDDAVKKVKIHPVKLGTSADLLVGQRVYAIGDALSFQRLWSAPHQACVKRSGCASEHDMLRMECVCASQETPLDSTTRSPQVSSQAQVGQHLLDGSFLPVTMACLI